jgi:predicted nucleic acid-binding protein
MSRCVVVDANRIFSELIATNHRLRQLFAAEPKTEFVCPKYVMVELFKHKERIVAATGLEEAELLTLLHSLLERIRFFDEYAISIGSWTEAWRLCRDVDENDVAYIALTLELDGELWTSDEKLEIGLRRKGFTRFFVPAMNR